MTGVQTCALPISIQRHVSTQSRLAQSNIDGVIGLEILRSDLEAAGYGLFWSQPTNSTGQPITIAFTETDTNPPKNAYNPTNPATGTIIPLAVQSGNDVFLNDSNLQLNGTDYLGLRGMTLPHNATSQRWSYMTSQMTFATISSAVPLTSSSKRINSWANNNFAATDRVIVVTGTEDKDPVNHRKLVTNGTTYFTQYSPTSNLDPYQPPPPTMPAIPHALTLDSPAYFIYGVDDTDLRMPYNRTDYYVRKPTGGISRVPLRCAPDTGILFKSVIIHSNGDQVDYPLLDCVADFQVVYSLDTGDVSASGLASLSAADIRNRLKNIQIYILTHDGKKDTSFTYPNQSIGVGPGNGLTSGSGSTRTFTQFSSSKKNYRWKVYRLTVAPKNLLPAQK